MKLLIYTSTRSEVMALEDELQGQPFRSPDKDTFKDDLDWFHLAPNAIMIVNIHAAATGFRVPSNTVVLFTGSIKDGPHKLQAMMRTGIEL